MTKKEMQNGSSGVLYKRPQSSGPRWATGASSLPTTTFGFSSVKPERNDRQILQVSNRFAKSAANRFKAEEGSIPVDRTNKHIFGL